MMFGYGGKILQIDLTNEKTNVDLLKKDDAEKFIGGIGLAIKLAYDNIKPHVDALGPENLLILTTGPLSGIMAPAGYGHAFASKSPLTGGIGVSITMGFFAGDMKKAGYDAIIFKGRSRKPSYVWIDDASVEFRDAVNLWNKSPNRTEQAIRKELGDDSIRVAAIGLAGTRLARIACVISDTTRVTGRTGIGGVMGSKNLKAIALRGSGGVKVADAQGLIEYCRKYFILARGSSAVKHYGKTGTSETIEVKDRIWTTTFEPVAKYRDLGTAEDIITYNALGCLPARNFNASVFEGTQRLGGEYFKENFVKKVQACSPCSISCEHIAAVNEGPYAGATASIDYGSVWAFGPNCGIDRPDVILKAIELCNAYGLDAISTGNVIGFAMDCAERGILTYEDTERLHLQFGNSEAMLEMIQKIGIRDGTGDILAEGVKRAAEKIGNGAEMLALQVKGVEMSGYDIRCLKTAALGFAVSFQGADESRNAAHLFDLRGKVNRFTVEKGRGKIVKDTEDLYAVLDSLIVCKFLAGVYEGFDPLAKLYNLATGLEIGSEELKKAGERINNLARLFNLREGLSRKDDVLPPKFSSVPIPQGASKGCVIAQGELDFMLDDYYSSRGWTEQGEPTKERLKELGL